MTTLTCKAVLFDLDGTLIDSRQSIDIAYKTWCDGHGLDFREVLKTAHGRRTIETVALLLPHKDTQEEAQKLEDLECAAVDGLVALSGAKELIGHLSSSQWAIVTSGSRRLATHRLTYSGIKPPTVFITAEDVSIGKPDPQGYMKAADLLGVAYADCVVFEDAPAGINAARAAGMRSVAFPTTHSVQQISNATICVADLHKLSIEIDSSPSANGELRVIIQDTSIV